MAESDLKETRRVVKDERDGKTETLITFYLTPDKLREREYTQARLTEIWMKERYGVGE